MVDSNDRFWKDPMSDFSDRLRALRTQRNLTQTRLAELLAVSPRVYNRWERGVATPYLDTIVKIANILQVSLDELAGRQPAPSEPRLQNPKLSQLYRQVDQLSDEDQQALVILMDSLVKRSQLAKVLRS
ncbi:MAG: XRE family transcriptional regulator [Acidobacteria bacterium]|nr:MAG: XRE family transcriptional regulator [Acidobacteriota bacterium]